MPRRNLRRVLPPAAAFLLLLSVGAAFVLLREPGRPATPEGASPRETPRAAAALGPEGTAPGGPEDTPGPSPGDRGGDPGRPSDADADPQRPPSTRPPAPGSYPYRLVKDGHEEETRTTVRALGGRGEAVLQSISIDNEVERRTDEVAWRPGGLFILRSTFPEGDEPCDWEPDLLEIDLPLDEGLRWSGEGSCTTILGGSRWRVERRTRAHVTGSHAIRVAGERVRAWTIEQTGALRMAQLEGVGLVVTEDWERRLAFSPAHGLVVRSSGSYTLDRGGGPDRTGSGQSEILDLEPG